MDECAASISREPSALGPLTRDISSQDARANGNTPPGGGRDSGKRLMNGGAKDSVCPPPQLNVRQHTPVLDKIALEATISSTTLDAPLDPQTYYQHQAPPVNLHLLHPFLKRLIPIDMRLLIDPLPLSLDSYKLGSWQQSTTAPLTLYRGWRSTTHCITTSQQATLRKPTPLHTPARLSPRHAFNSHPGLHHAQILWSITRLYHAK